MRCFLAWLLGVALAAAGASASEVRAVPAIATGPTIRYPRLAGFPGPTQALVNRQLAAAETRDRQDRTDCIAPSEDNDPGSWDERVRVTYLSHRYLNVVAEIERFCSGTPHPNLEIVPSTFDLATGAALDLSGALAPAFLKAPADGTGKAASYDLFFERETAVDEDLANWCRSRSAINRAEPDFQLWLDGSRGGGLVLSPLVGHADAPCAAPIVLPAPAIARYVRDPAFLGDLRRTVAKAAASPDEPGSAALTPPLRTGCEPRDLPGDLGALQAYEVVGGSMAHFLRTGEHCLDGEAVCRAAAFVLPGQVVVGGPIQESDLVSDPSGRWLCAFYPGLRGTVTGWLSEARVAPLAAKAVLPTGWAGTWWSERGRLVLTAQAGGVALSGEATTGQDTGDLQAHARPSGDRITFTPDAGCRVNLRRIGPYLAVEDKGACGGLGVTFAGLYRRG